MKTLVALGGQHRAPLGGGRLHAEAEERQRGDLEHGGGDAERGLHHERGERVGEDPVAQDAAVRHAEGAVGGDEVLLPDRQHAGPHDAGVDRDA